MNFSSVPLNRFDFHIAQLEDALFHAFYATIKHFRLSEWESYWTQNVERQSYVCSWIGVPMVFLLKSVHGSMSRNLNKITSTLNKLYNIIFSSWNSPIHYYKSINYIKSKLVHDFAACKRKLWSTTIFGGNHTWLLCFWQ